MHGGCSIPLGVYLQIHNDEINIDTIMCDLEGSKYVKRTITAPVDQTTTTAKKLAQQLLDEGGQHISTHKPDIFL